MHLHGVTNYGDSVEDEWLIVHLVRELSKRFEEIWVKVVDTDGEFLLIEAANALPRWLNPEIADNRASPTVGDTPFNTSANLIKVWLHGGELHIIPLNATGASSKQNPPISRSLGLQEALDIISSSPETIIHSPLIEAEAFYRLRNYPSQITASLHHAPITIPRKLAYILHTRRASIAPAVEAFYLRDPIALKTLDSPSSKLIFPPEDLVTVSTCFTKVLYAQLKSQQFSIPTAWKSILVEPENVPSETPRSKSDAKLEMGMKVTSGFEMLLRDTKYDDNRLVRELKIILEDLATDNNADLPTDEDIIKWKDVAREDDEKWLDINFEDFEKELQGKGQENISTQIPGAFGPDRPSGFGDAKTEADLKKMVERFETFLNDETAGDEGAELDDMDIDNDDATDIDSEEEDKEVSFNEEEFAKMMREMMGLPSEEPDENIDRRLPQSNETLGKSRQVEEIDSDEESNEESEDAKIREVMQRMEAELNEGGALNLDPTPKKLTSLKGKAHSDQSNDTSKPQNEDEGESDGEVDIDFNLAKNLLESFKSQAGMPGPGGNLMGMMGFQLPRDEDDNKSPTDT